MQNANASPLIDSITRAVGSVFAPGMIGIFLLSLLVTLAALFGFFAGTTAIVSYLTDGWFTWLASFGAGLIAWFLFPGILPIIVNFFDARIASLIEQKDYPSVRPINPPFWPEFWHDVRFSLSAILFNILALPLYFIPVINIFVFYVLNGFLLGKEFFIMVARRHEPLTEAKQLRAKHSRTIFIAGALLALLSTIPVVNLFAPFWGIAVMTHLYHALTGTPKTELLLPS